MDCQNQGNSENWIMCLLFHSHTAKITHIQKKTKKKTQIASVFILLHYCHEANVIFLSETTNFDWISLGFQFPTIMD